MEIITPHTPNWPFEICCQSLPWFVWPLSAHHGCWSITRNSTCTGMTAADIFLCHSGKYRKPNSLLVDSPFSPLPVHEPHVPDLSHLLVVQVELLFCLLKAIFHSPLSAPQRSSPILYPLWLYSFHLSSPLP